MTTSQAATTAKGKSPQAPPKTATVSNKDLVLSRRRDGGTNYIAWRELTKVKLRKLYPTIHGEFMHPTPTETYMDMMTRISDAYPPVQLQTLSVVVSDDTHAAGMLMLDPLERQRFWNIAIEAQQDASRFANLTISRNNETRSVLVKNLMEAEAKKAVSRIAMAALLLTPEYISADCLVTIQADGRYDDTGEGNTAWTIHEIIQDTLADHPGPMNQQRHQAERSLRNMSQGNTRLDIFNTQYKRLRDRCSELGAHLDETLLIDLYMNALNIEIFEKLKIDYYEDPTPFPDTLNSIMLHADKFYGRRCAVNPAISKVLGNTQGYAIYATHELEDEEDVEEISINAVKQADDQKGEKGMLSCQLCGKKGHSAADCWSLKNADKVKKYVEAAELKETKKTKKTKEESKGTGATGGPTPEGVASVRANEITDDDVAACAIKDLVEPFDLICQVIEYEGEKGLTDFEHDDHADVHVVHSDEGCEFFHTFL